jgi:uncharacterized protein YdhG (YjbR/CyaY superfamily)
MKNSAISPEEYIEQLPPERKKAVEQIRNTILANLPQGFKETMTYGMISFVVPKSIYQPGYHANPKLPLPFISIASQKNYISLYHMAVYMYPELIAWYQEEYKKRVKTKLDMGKGCIRFKKMENIPYDLLAELIRKISVNNYIRQYEQFRNQ